MLDPVSTRGPSWHSMRRARGHGTKCGTRQWGIEKQGWFLLVRPQTTGVRSQSPDEPPFGLPIPSLIRILLRLTKLLGCPSLHLEPRPQLGWRNSASSLNLSISPSLVQLNENHRYRGYLEALRSAGQRGAGTAGWLRHVLYMRNEHHQV